MEDNSILIYILENYFNVNVIVYKEKYIDKSLHKYFDDIIKQNLEEKINYRELIYKLVYENNIKEKIEILRNFNIHYISKMLAITYTNEITEIIADIEKYIYNINNESILYLYSILPYTQLPRLIVYPPVENKTTIEDKVNEENLEIRKVNITTRIKQKNKPLW